MALEHIKEDLKAFVNENWRHEMRELSAGLRREVCQELHKCFGEALGLASVTASEDLDPWTPRTPPMVGSFPQAPGDAAGGGSISANGGRRPSKVRDIPKPLKPNAWGKVQEPKVAPPALNVPFHENAYPKESPVVLPTKGPQFSPLPPTATSRRTMRQSVTSLSSRMSCKRTDSMIPNADRSTAKAPRKTKRHTRAQMSQTHRFNQAMQAELKHLSDHKELMEGRCSSLLRTVSNPYFDYFIFIVLVANAAIIGAQVDWLASDPDGQLPMAYRMLNIGFTLVFMIELALRWMAWGRRFFATDDWLWNIFDLLVLAFSVLDELAQVFLEGTKPGDVIDSMGVLRVLRVGRLARIVRMVRIIPTLKSMVYLIMASMPSFVWTVVLMLMLMYCIAVYFTEVATELLRMDLGEPRLGRTWGSVGSSIMSLWSAITGGDDWRNITDVFGDNEYYQVNLVLFSLYISFAVLVMLNLVTGVFVDGMQRIIRDDKERELVKTAVGVFSEADIDQNEDLSEDEFADILDSEALDDYFLALGIQADEAGKLFHVLDTDKSGTLTLGEFVYGCVRLSANARVVDIALSERNLKTAIDDLETILVRIAEDVGYVRNRVEQESMKSTPREDYLKEQPSNHHCENVSLYAEKQAVFLSQRYLCEWGMGATEDA